MSSPVQPLSTVPTLAKLRAFCCVLLMLVVVAFGTMEGRLSVLQLQDDLGVERLYEDDGVPGQAVAARPAYRQAWSPTPAHPMTAPRPLPRSHARPVLRAFAASLPRAPPHQPRAPPFAA